MKNTLLALPLALVCSGCCALAELFCGPDRSAWVSVSFDSPRAALETFVEACRRDDSGVSYRCMSQAFRDRYGAGQFEWAVIWEKIKEDVPIHLLGNASIESPAEHTPDRAQFVLTRLGQQVELILIRQSYQEIAWYEDGELVEGGEVIPSFRGRAAVRVDNNGVANATLRVQSETSVEELELHEVHRLALGREWKVDDIRPVTDSQEIARPGSADSPYIRKRSRERLR